MPEEKNDKPTTKESMGGSQKKKSYNHEDESSAAHKDEEVSPLGEDIIPVFYVVFNKKLQNFGLIGANGFLNNRVEAYGALKMAEKQLDEYYRKIDRARDSIITKVANFDAKQAFRSFIRRK